MPEKKKLSDVISKKKEKEKAAANGNTVVVEGTQRENSSPSRRGKKQIGGHFDPEVSRQLKIAAAKEDKTIEQILGDAINEYFEKRGIPPIA